MTDLHCAYDFDASGRALELDLAATDEAAPSGSFRWLHFQVGPEFERWAKEHLPPVALQTLSQRETRPRCDRYEDGTALNLRGVNLNPADRVEDMVSLRIWFTSEMMVSARIRPLATVDSVRAAIAAGKTFRSPGDLLMVLAGGLTDRMEIVALDLEDQTDELEDRRFDHKAVNVEEIITLRRTVIMLRRFAVPQREALARLAAIDGPELTRDTAIALREIANRATRNAEALEALRERLAILQDHADARISNNMGRNAYVLSVVAAIFLPLSFLTGLFGVNVAGMPGVVDPRAFAILCGAMVFAGIALLAFFRWKRWL
jgi:zinc transporter